MISGNYNNKISNLPKYLNYIFFELKYIQINNNRAMHPRCIVHNLRGNQEKSILKLQVHAFALTGKDWTSLHFKHLDLDNALYLFLMCRLISNNLRNDHTIKTKKCYIVYRFLNSYDILFHVYYYQYYYYI